MEFRTFCNNKGCRKEMRPVVDTKTLKAYCTECDQEVSTITEFMRRQMVAGGQVRSNIKKKMPWSVKCSECTVESQPKLTPDNKLICSACQKELTQLTKPFAESIKIHLRNMATKKE